MSCASDRVAERQAPVKSNMGFMEGELGSPAFKRAGEPPAI